MLNSPVGYTPDTKQYAHFLQCGLEALETLQAGNFEATASGEDVQAEYMEPVIWEFSVEKIADGEYDIIGSATIQEGWHVYSQNIPEDGPIPTTFYLYDDSGELHEVEAGEARAIVEQDPVFEMELRYFEDETSFRIPFSGETGGTVKGLVSFMTCNESQCLPPADIEFEVTLN